MKKLFFLLIFLTASKILFAQNSLDSLIIDHYGDTIGWNSTSEVQQLNALNVQKSQIQLEGKAMQVLSVGVSGENEAANWVFGNNLGVKFNSDGSKTLLTSSMNAGEGCASISDTDGNLLFYTEGTKVYNSSGQMINTQTMQGSNQSTQSSIIVPYPGSSTKYFIFTVPDTYQPHGLFYSIVDMSQTNSQGGLGVLLKVDGTNEYKLIKENCVERVASVKHKNNTDYWIIADYKGTNEYYCYQVTENGVDIENPVINSIGSAHVGSNTYGGVKLSSDGTKFASVRGGLGDPRVEIFDFDNETGILSNYQDITPASSANSFYGLEFSPNGRFLYVSTLAREIFQIDLLNSNSELLQSSGGTSGGMLQLGIDGNIYFAQIGPSLYYFEAPNEIKNSSSFALNIIPLNTGQSVGRGLPSIISSFTSTSCLAFDIDFSHYPHSCGTKFIPKFENENDCDITSYYWDFGDGTTSTEAEPFHVYASQDVFDVKLKLTFECDDECGIRSDSVIRGIDLTEDVFEQFETIEVESFIIDSVLSASASSFSDSWFIEYDDENLSENHPYLNGRKGVWRNNASYVYRADRGASENTNIKNDGTFQLESFNWAFAQYEAVPGWLKANTVTQYSPYSYETENRDILDNYSSALYSYGGQMPVAIGQNMQQNEMAFTSFEELDANGFTIVDDASQKGSGNWTLSLDATRGKLNVFDVKAGYGNLAMVSAPIEDFDDIDTVTVKMRSLVVDFGPFDFPIPVFRQFSKVAILCKESYGEFNEKTKLAFDRVIDERIWAGQLWYYKPYKRGTISNISEVVAHTGIKSLSISSPRRIRQNSLELKPGKEYMLSAWASVNDKHLYVPVLAQNIGIRLLFFDEEETQIENTFLEPTGNIIEGWQKLEGTFTYPENAAYFSIEYDPGTATTAYFDDLRLFPSEGNMQTYVYELETYRLKAVLDENNYASLYYYDPEGNLYLVKKETDRGIRAIQESVSYQKINESGN